MAAGDVAQARLAGGVDAGAAGVEEDGVLRRRGRAPGRSPRRRWPTPAAALAAAAWRADAASARPSRGRLRRRRRSPAAGSGSGGTSLPRTGTPGRQAHEAVHHHPSPSFRPLLTSHWSPSQSPACTGRCWALPSPSTDPDELAARALLHRALRHHDGVRPGEADHVDAHELARAQLAVGIGQLGAQEEGAGLLAEGGVGEGDAARAGKTEPSASTTSTR